MCRVFGPTAAAARLEGSKTFMKNLCAKYDIPSAAYATFKDPDEAKNYIRRQVVKYSTASIAHHKRTTPSHLSGVVALEQFS